MYAKDAAPYATGGAPDQVIRAAVEQTVGKAKQAFNLEFEGEYPISGGIGIAAIRPNDVGHPTSAKNYWSYTFSSADSFASWISTPIDKDIFVLLTGIFDTQVNPGLNEIQITANGQAMPVMQMDFLKTLLEPKMYFPKPIGVSSSATLTVAATSRIAQAEEVGLLGYTIGKRAFLITQ